MEERGTLTTAEKPDAAAETPAVPPEGRNNRPKKKSKKRRKAVKITITCLIIAIVLGGIGFGMYRLFFYEEEVQVMTEFLYRGALQSMVQGSGVTKPKDSANIVVKAKGEVKRVYVEAGQNVTAGDKLYEIDSSTAEDELAAAEKKLSGLQKDLSDTYEKIDYLNITAPHKGKLSEVAEIEIGDTVSEGMVIATLCDDSQMKLTQYFSYAYEHDIYIGMYADISIPESMALVPGRVSNIEKVRKITPEGTVLFEVEFLIDNPGALTENMTATATAAASDGSVVTPAEAGKLEYSRKTSVKAKTSGTVRTLNHLRNYYDVGAGAVLVGLESDMFDDSVSDLEKQIEKAEEDLKAAQDMFDSFNAVAPIDGIVMSCAILEGQTVESGTVAITISDITVIMVEAQIDEMDVNKIQPQMPVDIIQYDRDREIFMPGIFESVSLEGKYENGVSFFPAMIRVENTDGAIKPGMYISYRVVASQKDDCLIAPVYAVKYTEVGTCLFVRNDRQYENQVELGEGIVPDGFVAVIVETGMGNDTGIEILSGAEEGFEVYTQEMNQNPQGMW